VESRLAGEGVPDGLLPIRMPLARNSRVLPAEVFGTATFGKSAADRVSVGEAKMTRMRGGRRRRFGFIVSEQASE
jgi:hypothetical protein